MHIQYICMYDFLFHLRYIWLSWQLIYFSIETGFLEAKIYIFKLHVFILFIIVKLFFIFYH